MVAYADTGFLASLYLKETTSLRARVAAASATSGISVIPLVLLELRNAFNLAVKRERITIGERDKIWTDVENDLASGYLALAPLSTLDLYSKARELSDLYTPAVGTRTLDLLHVAAAHLIQANVFFSFDERQRKAADAEGLDVRPSKLG